MLAPVLARLEGIDGVVGARVECSGNYFLVTARSADALEVALPEIVRVLGPSTRKVEPRAAEAQLAARGRGEPWFSSEEVRGLSYVEGRILAARVTDAVGAAVELDAALGERLREAARLEVFAALEHAHDTGGRPSPGWFWEEWPRVAERIASRLEDCVPEQALPRLRAALSEACSGGRRRSPRR